jgi:hypothetical protein
MGDDDDVSFQPRAGQQDGARRTCPKLQTFALFALLASSAEAVRPAETPPQIHLSQPVPLTPAPKVRLGVPHCQRKPQPWRRDRSPAGRRSRSPKRESPSYDSRSASLLEG